VPTEIPTASGLERLTAASRDWTNSGLREFRIGDSDSQQRSKNFRRETAAQHHSD
jgi:hypothetical protein